MNIRVECTPAFNYALSEHEVSVSAHGAAFHSDDLAMGLATSVPLKIEGNGITADFELSCGEDVNFVLHELKDVIAVKGAFLVMRPGRAL